MIDIAGSGDQLAVAIDEREGAAMNALDAFAAGHFHEDGIFHNFDLPAGLMTGGRTSAAGPACERPRVPIGRHEEERCGY